MGALVRSIRTEPHNDGEEGDERIRTAVTAPSDVSTYGQVAGAWGFPHVAGNCPSCGAASLFLAVGGHVTCSVIGCADPCMVDDWLHGKCEADRA